MFHNQGLLEAIMDPEYVFDAFCRERYGWAFPSGEAMDALATLHAGERVVEIGSGSGYVAACLRARGFDVVAVNGADGSWSGWWGRRFVDDFEVAMASALAYDARAYLMVMPDAPRGGEDMMAEALFRMPVGAALHVYAPEHCSGSGAGALLLARHFEEVGRLPMANRFPFEENGSSRGLRSMRKASQPAAMPDPVPRARPFGKPARLAA